MSWSSKAIGLVAAGLLGLGALVSSSCGSKEPTPAPSPEKRLPKKELTHAGAYLLFLEFEEDAEEGSPLRIIHVSRRRTRPIQQKEVESRANALANSITERDGGVWLVEYSFYNGPPSDEGDRRIGNGHFLIGNRVSVEVMPLNPDERMLQTTGRAARTTLRIPIPYVEGATTLLLERCGVPPSPWDSDEEACKRDLDCYPLGDKDDCPA